MRKNVLNFDRETISNQNIDVFDVANVEVNNATKIENIAIVMKNVLIDV